MHCFRYNELLLLGGNDVLANSSQGALQAVFDSESETRFRIHGQTTFLFCLEGFSRSSTFWFSWDFPRGAEWFLGVPNVPPKLLYRGKHLLGGHFLLPNYVFRNNTREIIFISWPVEVRMKKSRKAGRSQMKYIWRIRVDVEQPLAGGFKAKWARSSCPANVIKRAEFHCHNSSSFGAVRC
jgi:hypothetical protein